MLEFLTGGIGLVLSLGFTVLYFLAIFKVFSKAGQPGIFAFIPVINIITAAKIAGMNPWVVLLFLVPFVNVILAFVLLVKFLQAFDLGIGTLILYLFFAPFVMLYMGFSNKVQYLGA